MSNYSINQELLSYFTESLKTNSNKHPSTIENIVRDIKYFLDYLHEHRDTVIDSRSIVEYLTHLEDKYIESSYIVKASSIRQFVNWLNLEENPFWNIKLNISYNDFQYYQQGEIFSQFSQGFEYEHLLVRMIYELYLSLNELTLLNLGDFNRAKGSISLRGQEIIVSDQLKVMLRDYLKTFRGELLQGGGFLGLQDPLFITRKKNAFADTKVRISEVELQEILQKYSLRSSQIKRTRIIDLLNEGKELSEIEDYLGIKLGNFYQPFVKEKEYRLLSSYRQFHPRSKIGS